VFFFFFFLGYNKQIFYLTFEVESLNNSQK